MILAGCKEGDGEADYGFGYVYMPQASFTGVDNHYPVPSGNGINTYNFVVSEGKDKLNIILGVSRSGKITNAGGFSVNVRVSPAETDEVIVSGEIENAMALPSGMYQMPDLVTVEAGKNSASFYLSVDVNQLKNNTYDGSNLVLAVEISNPTNNFELAEMNTSVVVVIDVDAIQEFISN
ncbi:MAG: DUF1735 domain-containing protein [Bacteroidales bacterium]|nr:DUF1735 domain-containing protein [Bacteroidales bacterium]